MRVRQVFQQKGEEVLKCFSLTTKSHGTPNSNEQDSHRTTKSLSIVTWVYLLEYGRKEAVPFGTT